MLLLLLLLMLLLLHAEVYNTSIVLSHWGRMDFHHVSGTAWGYDNYSQVGQQAHVSHARYLQR